MLKNISLVTVLHNLDVIKQNSFFCIIFRQVITGTGQN